MADVIKGNPNSNVTVVHGTYHLTDNPASYEPVRTNNFRFLVHGLDEYIPNAQEVIDFSVISFDVPHFSQGTINVDRGNSRANYAGKPSFNTRSLQINDFVGADGKSVLLAWQALSYDVETDSISRSYVYKKNATILEYLPDGTLIRYWDLIGCWVSGIDETGYSNSGSDKKTVTATITYDRAIPHLPD